MISCPDSIRPEDLPPGYSAYLGYVDGNWPTITNLEKRFPGAHLLGLTVTGNTLHADGIDVEPGNPDARSAAFWAEARLTKDPPGFRPVIYASVIGSAGYGMHDVLRELAARGRRREEFRLLSAHYGAGRHICGPSSCGEIDTDMDGTQWTDQFPVGEMGAETLIDMSALRDDFFGPVPTRTEVWVKQLGIVRQGMTGEAVRTVQGLCNARDVTRTSPIAIDGVFGPKTEAAVQWFQMAAKIANDGVVGPQTWPVLLGIA